jgi:hypothetical protein
MTREDIEAVLAKEPELSALGKHVHRRVPGSPPGDRERRLHADRERLLDDVDGCSRAERWLGTIAARAQSPWQGTHYSRYEAEAEVGGLTDGAFLVAAIHLGLEYSTTRGYAAVVVPVARRRPTITSRGGAR